MKKFFAEFKEFISRGNVIDLAVGVIIGGAFSAIVTSLTDNIIIFCIVKAINKMLDLTKKKEEHKEEAPTTKICPFCKSEIPIDAVKCCHCTSDLPKEDE